MPGIMQFGLLGPLVVRCGDTVVPVRRGSQRVLLAVLLLEANRVVPVDAIVEALWGAAPPPSASATVRNYVRRLREALGEAARERIITQPRGYLIRAADGELDVARFERLLAAAQAAALAEAWKDASAQASLALGLWRGAPLGDIASETLVRREVPRLAELRLQAFELRIGADLQLGTPAGAVAELQRLTAAHPLREHLHALLMLALYRSARQADALAAYQRARRMLADELGAEPGTELRSLHRQILSADPALALPQPARAEGGAASATVGVLDGVVPRQLPAATAYFTGRAEELAALTRILDRDVAQTPGTVVISAIGGMAGAGKTALAVHWAHQAASRFPDGQLYVNLRGFDPSATPAATGEAIRGFLDALGVPSGQIPHGPDAQAGLYRSLLAGRRMLIVLDNARDELQVRPLLPAAPGCMVIVTSRNQLGGLAATDGAYLLTIDALTAGEAAQMLTTRFGTARAAAEPDAISEIAGLCANLPLALAVAAARAAARPSFPLSALATELRDARGRLDVLDAGGDQAASVRAVFSWSYRQLSPGAARMFRLLGLHPGPDISASAVASLAGIHRGQAGALLHELTRAHLLSEHNPGRYTCHDLLRAYATDQAQVNDSEAERVAAADRVLDHYLHTAHCAALRLSPARASLALPTPRTGVTPEQPADYQQALDWFEAEHRVLLAALTLAAGARLGAHAWQIPWTMVDYLNRRGHSHELVAIQRTALSAATLLGDPAGQAESRRLLANACCHSGDYDQAVTHLLDCIALYQQLGDRAGEARVHQALSYAAHHQYRYADALSHAEQALGLFRAIGHQAGLAEMLNNVGWCHALLGDYQQARSFCRQALTLHHELGERLSSAHVWDSLGYAEHKLGHHDQAIDCYQHALGLFREFGDRFDEAEILTHLGDTYHAADDRAAARRAWQQALDILDSLTHRDASDVRVKLATLDDHIPASAAAG